MRFYQVSFFAEGDVTLIADVKRPDDYKPVSIFISEDFERNPGITIHMHDKAFIGFKNCVLEAYDKFQKTRGYKR